MKWFVQQRGVLGGWYGVIYHGDRPSARRADGQVTCFRSDPVPVPRYLDDMPISDLERFLTLEGEFFHQDDFGRRAIAAFIRNPESAMIGDAE